MRTYARTYAKFLEGICIICIICIRLAHLNNISNCKDTTFLGKIQIISQLFLGIAYIRVHSYAPTVTLSVVIVRKRRLVTMMASLLSI